MRIFGMITLFFLISFYGFSQGVISGSIKSEDGTFLPFANVSITLPNGKVMGTSADVEGHFSLKIGPGKYTVKASYLAYSNNVEEVIVREGEISSIEFILLENAVLLTCPTIYDSRPFTVNKIFKKEIEKQNLGQDVPYLLKMTTSAVVTSDAGAGVGYSGIRIRGSDQTNINVTVNGIPLNDSESHQVYWVDLPDVMASADNLEIERGVGASKNGAGAFGATINIATKSPIKKPNLILATTYGSFNTQKYSVDAGTGSFAVDDDPVGGTVSFNGRVSRIKSDGYIDRASSNLNSFFLSGNYNKNFRSLQFNLISGHEITYQAWNGVPQNYIDTLGTYNSAGTDRTDKPHPDQVDNYKQTHYQLIFEDRINDKIKVNAALHYTKGAGYYEQYKGAENIYKYGSDTLILGGTLIEESDLIRRKWLDNDFYGGVFNINFPVLDGLDIGGGLNEYKGRHFGKVIWSQLSAIPQGHEYYRNEALKQDFNIYAKAKKYFSNLNTYIDLQYRKVNYNFVGLDDQGVSFPEVVKHHFFNPKVGISYNFEHVVAYASMAVAHREPNRNDYQSNPINSKPKAERLIDWEAGLREQSGNFQYTLNGFFMKYKNQLVLTGKLTEVGEYARVNVPVSYRLGVEADVIYQASNWFTVGGNLTLSQNRIKEFTEYIDNWDTWTQEAVVHKNTYLSFSPRITSAILLKGSFLDKKLNASLAGKYVGKQYIDNTTNDATSLAGYFYNDLQINYLLKKSKVNYLLNLKVFNLLNRKYSSNAWAYRYRTANEYIGPYDQAEGQGTYSQVGLYPQAGVNFLLGLTVTF